MTSMNPKQAAKAIRTAQVVVFAAFALAAVLFFLPTVLTPDVERIDPRPISDLTPPKPSESSSKQTTTRSNWGELTPLLSWATPEPVSPKGATNSDSPGGAAGTEANPENGDVENAGEGGSPTQSANRSLPGWRFIGRITRPAGDLALLSINGSQRMISTGQEIDGYTVDAIDADAVILSRGALVQRVTAEPSRPVDLGITTLGRPAPRNTNTQRFDSANRDGRFGGDTNESFAEQRERWLAEQEELRKAREAAKKDPEGDDS